MKKFNKGMFASAALAAAVIGGTAVAAQAATTYTPTGTSLNFVKTTGLTAVSFTDIEAGQTLSCSTFSLANASSTAVISSGTSRAYGAAGATLPTITSSGCTNPLAGATTVTPTGTWGVTVTGDKVGTVVPARLTSVAANLSAANCNFSIGGVVNGKFDTSNQRFTPNTGASGLTITNIPAGTPSAPQTMCTTLDLVVGDTISVSGSWTNSGGALAVTTP
ncbi:hypothetical protein [Aeromicrobium endophyticum]|uniref:Uncharacterized protein n=1 Tax=Aeromicrobium endophyticum TaxID=2292704 RepID=A0A371PA60_9ACTN|nr:hypothetical protein [Aeromicrobium endophyticum]REK72807.1 hypothetical protein DX116_04185 [Aeromicrobium endophyticum]